MSFRFVTQPEIRREARRILPLEVWNFGDGASETELTKKRNRQALDRLAIRQDILVDAREIDTATTLCGVPLSWPVVIARACCEPFASAMVPLFCRSRPMAITLMRCVTRRMARASPRGVPTTWSSCGTAQTETQPAR